jgi:hypothetical protein
MVSPPLIVSMHAPIFYSWQSDTPADTGKAFLHEALRIAADRIASDVDSPFRPELDHDTRGVPGTPSMVAAILAKIDTCAVLVADVTLSFHRRFEPPKLAPNPNVLLELGYGLRRLGTERVLIVLDSAYGAPEQLPFDLRGSRAVVYSSVLAATDPVPTTDQLVADLEGQLRTIFGTAGLPSDLAPRLTIEVGYERLHIEGTRHDYRLTVNFSNRGNEIITGWAAEVRLPKAVLDPAKHYPLVPNADARDPTAILRMTEREHSGPLYPGDSKRVLNVDYLMNRELYDRRVELFPMQVTAAAFVEQKVVSRTSAYFRDLQCF